MTGEPTFYWKRVSPRAPGWATKYGEFVRDACARSVLVC